MSERYVAAIDQGTTSSRCMLFDAPARIVAVAQKEHRQIFPRPGWVEHDPRRSGPTSRRWSPARWPRRARRRPTSPRSASPTSARRRWSGTRRAGRPIANAIVWQDTRTDQLVARAGRRRSARTASASAAACRWRPTSPAPRCAGCWTTSRRARARAERGELLFGTIDAWLIWNLTGRHVTDVTNACRTMLMNLATLDWDDGAARARSACRAPCCRRSGPRRRSTARRAALLEGVPVASALGDQQAALFGQTCFAPGEGKCTYGTGSFLLVNTGERPVASNSGLLTTRRLPDRRRGAGLCAGGLDRGHRLAGAVGARQPRPDRLGAGDRGAGAHASPTTAAATSCRRSPACSRRTGARDARGVIAGLTGYVTKGHIARAVLEAAAWQTREVVDAMAADAGAPLTRAEGRRRHDRQRPPDAVPGRRAGRAGGAPGGHRDHLPGRRLRRRPRGRLLAGPRDAARNWRKDAEWLPPMEDPDARTRLPPVEEGGGSGRWTGSTTTTTSGVARRG